MKINRDDLAPAGLIGMCVFGAAGLAAVTSGPLWLAVLLCAATFASLMLT